MKYDYPDVKNIVVCGDIHGAFVEMVFKLCVWYGMKDTLLIVAGDCGFGFEKPGYYEQIFTKVSRRLLVTGRMRCRTLTNMPWLK